jgi:hypothetical protein
VVLETEDEDSEEVKDVVTEVSDDEVEVVDDIVEVEDAADDVDEMQLALTKGGLPASIPPSKTMEPG